MLKLLSFVFLWITSVNVRPFTQFLKKYSSYVFFGIKVGVLFKGNSFIREDAAFCIFDYFIGFILVYFVSHNRIFFGSQIQFSKTTGDC